MVNGWKVTAIFCIILLILSWGSFIYVWRVGVNIIEKDKRCGSLCSQMDCEGYSYNFFENLCSCYIDHEVVYQGNLK